MPIKKFLPLLLLCGFPILSQAGETMPSGFFAGLNGSGGGSADGAGAAVEMGILFDNDTAQQEFFKKKVLSFEFGMINNQEESPSFIFKPSTTALLNATDAGSFRNEGEFFGCAEWGFSLSERWFLSGVLGASIESTQVLLRSTSGELISGDEKTKAHFLYGGNLRVTVWKNFFIVAGYAERRGAKLGFDFIIQ